MTDETQPPQSTPISPGGVLALPEIKPAVRWWWVRHAPVTVNRGCIYGQDDLPCETGDAEAFKTLASFLPRKAAWVVSNLQRTHQTAAAIIAAGLPGPARIPGPDVIVEPDFAEQHFGLWQGKRYEALAAERAADYHRFWLAPATERAPGGESFLDVQARVEPVIHRLNRTRPARDLIVVAHGGTIRAALGLALGLNPEAALAFAIDNLAVCRIDWYDGEEVGRGHAWRIAWTNRQPH